MKKKLVEVSLPLDVINDAAAYDKMPGIGAHPKGIHHWWARLPLPAARAILFASLVDDPSANPEQFPTEAEQEAERERLFDMMRQLCQKKIHTKQEVFQRAHEEISKHCGGKLPTVLDPFAGGGSIPLEGMRLGLPVLASDLNPVAVLINKAQLEILPRFADQQPVNPAAKNKPGGTYTLAKGLAEDLRYYGQWVNDRAKERIGKYYPKAKIGNKEHNVIAWLWARTIKCPNPACGCEMPLVRSFVLSTKKKPNFYSEPIVERTADGNRVTGYEVKQGTPDIKGTKDRNGATCVGCGEAVKLDYIRTYGKKNGYGTTLIGLVVDIGRGKTYVSPSEEQESIVCEIPTPPIDLNQRLVDNPRYISPPLYGLNEYSTLFTNRQLLGLSTLQEIVSEARSEITQNGGSDE